MNEIREKVLRRLTENLKDMSDIDYQKRVWLRGEGPEVDSYCEFVNTFYPDIENVLENFDDFNLTEQQRIQIARLYNEFDKFKHTYYDEYEFIDSQEWKEIRELAAETLKVLCTKD